MLSDIPLAVLGDVGSTALVGLFVLLVFTGRVVPRSVHQDAIQQRDRAEELLKKRGETIHAQQETIGTQAATIRELSEVGRLAEKTWEAVRQETRGAS